MDTAPCSCDMRPSASCPVPDRQASILHELNFTYRFLAQKNTTQCLTKAITILSNVRGRKNQTA